MYIQVTRPALYHLSALAYLYHTYRGTSLIGNRHPTVGSYGAAISSEVTLYSIVGCAGALRRDAHPDP